MTTPTMNLNAGLITAGGNIGNVNSNNTVYNRDPKERRIELANWVSDLNSSQYHSQAFERYTEGTLLWALDEPEFIAWVKEGGMLWCPGRPGAGKTVFASFIINHLQNLSLNPKSTVCYVYHRYDTTRTTLQFFEGILKQLIMRCPSLNIQHVQAAHDQGQRLMLKEILSILQETFTNTPNIFIVIDAFDECFDEPTRHRILLHLQALNSVSILITSRPLPSLETAMGTVQKLIISAHSMDIRIHFRAETKINSTLSKLVPKVSDTDIEGKLVEKADGRFLLAGLHITNLAAQTNVNQLLRALETLPHEVTATYEETLDRIRRQKPTLRRLAFHTLSWIFYALRPFTLIELKHALAIGDLDRMAKEEDLADEEIILSSCAGLVVLNRSYDYNWHTEVVSVNFLHYTVQEFLQHARTAPDFLSDIEIALRSMKVISFPGISSAHYPLFRYAVSAWGPLVRRHEEDETVFELALFQLGDAVTLRILSHAQIDTKLQSYGGGYQGRWGATAIHLMAVYGLARIMKTFVSSTTSTSINETDRLECTALTWAAKNGHVEVVKELLSHPNIHVNSESNSGRTPLSYAAAQGHLEIVKELLSHPNIHVDSESNSGDTPLSFAAAEGHLDVVKELLVVSNVNSADGSGCTPLNWAVGSGNLEIVKELLAVSNVDVNSRGQNGQTPLSRAAANGHLEAVKELLSHPNIHVNSESHSGRTPLSYAVTQGHLEVVKELLIISNANSTDGSGRTPLSWAAESGNLEAVKELLVVSNVDVNSRDRASQTPLLYATANGSLEVIKELITHPKINVNSTDDSGRAPLSWAAERGNLEIVRELLVVSNVDVDSRDNARQTPLFYATANGHLGVVKKLITHPNIDVNPKDEAGNTPLLLAAANGQSEIVKELLTHPNIDVNPKDEASNTPLLFAAANGHSVIVTELLTHPNIDVDPKDDAYGQTPLSWAALNGHLEVVRLLAYHTRVDVNSRDTYRGLTPLLWAVDYEHWAVVDLLLDTGRTELPGNRKFSSSLYVPQERIVIQSPEDFLSLRSSPHSETVDVLLPNAHVRSSTSSQPALRVNIVVRNGRTQLHIYRRSMFPLSSTLTYGFVGWLD